VPPSKMGDAPQAASRTCSPLIVDAMKASFRNLLRIEPRWMAKGGVGGGGGGGGGGGVGGGGG